MTISAVLTTVLGTEQNNYNFHADFLKCFILIGTEQVALLSECPAVKTPDRATENRHT
jgi:hypothetical protein